LNYSGLVSGVCQINAVVPMNASKGENFIVISAGRQCADFVLRATGI